MDSLGGILIGGLLGNMIVAKFNLGWFGVEVSIPPSTRPYVSGGDGGFEEERVRTRMVRVWLRLNQRDYDKTYVLSEKRANVVVKAIEKAKSIQESVKVTVGKIFLKDK